jgi:hypothetical protein
MQLQDLVFFFFICIYIKIFFFTFISILIITRFVSIMINYFDVFASLHFTFMFSSLKMLRHIIFIRKTFTFRTLTEYRSVSFERIGAYYTKWLKYEVRLFLISIHYIYKRRVFKPFMK